MDADSEVEDNGGVDSVVNMLLSLLSLSVVCSPLYDPAIQCQYIRLLRNQMMKHYKVDIHRSRTMIVQVY